MPRPIAATSNLTCEPSAHFWLSNGRFRIGYRIGEALFGGLRDRGSERVILQLTGERPGSGHRTYLVYLTSLPVRLWGEEGRVDHNATRVISGISNTSLNPTKAAAEILELLSKHCRPVSQGESRAGTHGEVLATCVLSHPPPGWHSLPSPNPVLEGFEVDAVI